MKDFSKIEGDLLQASEFMETASELENVITSSGQSLTSIDLEQVSKAIAGYVSSGNFYSDSGSANAYVLTKVGSLKRSPDYSDGFKITFFATDDNTTASTVDVDTLGTKSIKLSNGDDPVAGDISGFVEAIYKTSLGYFILQNPKVTNVTETFGSMSAFLNSDTRADYIEVQGYISGWAGFVEPKGKGVLYKDGTTGTASTEGYGVTNSGRFFNALGVGYSWDKEVTKVSPFHFGAVADWNGSTGTVDDESFIRAGYFIQRVGGGDLYFGDSSVSYLLRDDAASLVGTAANTLRTLMDFSDLNGVNIISNGANIILGRDYAASEFDVLFRFLRCSNVSIGSFNCSCAGTRASSTVGGILAYFRNGNRNISSSDQIFNKWAIGYWDNPISAENNFTNFWSSKRFRIDASETGYPLLTDNGCNGLRADVFSDLAVRSCTLQDVKNADVNIYSTDFTASNDVGLSGTLKNVNVRYFNLHGVKASQDDCLSLQYPSEYNTDISPISGDHEGADSATVLTDSSQSWVAGSLVGFTAINLDDASKTVITANTTTTFTGALSQGYTNTWKAGNRYIIVGIAGTHDGGNSSADLIDSIRDFPVDGFITYTVRNTTDGSFATITDNDGTTVVGALQGGATNLWNDGDTYTIGKSHEVTNVDLQSHVESFNGKFLGYALRVGVGVGASSAERDPNYKLRRLSLKCICRTDDNVNQQTFQIEHPTSWIENNNFEGLTIYDSSFEGGLPPVPDVRGLKTTCDLKNIESQFRFQYKANSSSFTRASNVKAPAISENTSDTTRMVLEGCDIGSDFDSHQSITNKQFIGCYANGKEHTTEFVLGQQKQSFTLEIRNNGGTIEHRIVVNRGITQLPKYANKISGASTTWTATPTVDSGTDFATGVGILSSNQNQIVLNTASQTSANELMLCNVEYYDGAVSHPAADVLFNSENVNGTIQYRLHIRLVTQNTGAAWTVGIGNIPSGKSIAIGFLGNLA